MRYGKFFFGKRNRGLTKEQLAVLRSSPNLKPCRKFRKVSTARFVEHLGTERRRWLLLLQINGRVRRGRAHQTSVLGAEVRHPSFRSPTHCSGCFSSRVLRTSPTAKLHSSRGKRSFRWTLLLVASQKFAVPLERFYRDLPGCAMNLCIGGQRLSSAKARRTCKQRSCQ